MFGASGALIVAPVAGSDSISRERPSEFSPYLLLRPLLRVGRWVLLLALAAALFLGQPHLRAPWVRLGLAAALVGYALLSMALLRASSLTPARIVAVLAADLAFIALLVESTGGMRSVFFGFYYLVVVASALFYELAGGLVAAAAVIGITTPGEGLGFHGAAPPAPEAVVTTLPYLLLAAIVAGHLTGQLKLAVREAHHRNKNNLQAVSDLLYLEMTAGDGAPSEEALRGSIEQIQAIASVHDLLSQDEDVRVVDARAVIDRLAPMVLRSSHRPLEEIAITLDVASVPLSSKRATSLALIFNELVSNAVKHAGKDNGRGELHLSLRQESEELVLRVQDNGPGLPAEFTLDTYSHVGLDVVRTLAERDLNGTFTLKSQEGVLAEVRFVWRHCR